MANVKNLDAALEQHNLIVSEMNAVTELFNARQEARPAEQRERFMTLQALALGALYGQFICTLDNESADLMVAGVSQTLTLNEAGRRGLLKTTEKMPAEQTAEPQIPTATQAPAES